MCASLTICSPARPRDSRAHGRRHTPVPGARRLRGPWGARGGARSPCASDLGVDWGQGRWPEHSPGSPLTTHKTAKDQTRPISLGCTGPSWARCALPPPPERVRPSDWGAIGGGSSAWSRGRRSVFAHGTASCRRRVTRSPWPWPLPLLWGVARPRAPPRGQHATRSPVTPQPPARSGDTQRALSRSPLSMAAEGRARADQASVSVTAPAAQQRSLTRGRGLAPMSALGSRHFSFRGLGFHDFLDLQPL